MNAGPLCVRPALISGTSCFLSPENERATFVARSFSGDKKQLVPLIKAGLTHKGPAFIDVISPCVAFNNHPGSTEAYDFVREHNEAVNRLDYITSRDEITVAYDPGTTEEVTQHDGSVIRLSKLAPEYDPHDRGRAMAYLQAREAAGEIVTGLIYLDAEPEDLHAHLNTVSRPLNRLSEKDLCPGSASLEALNN